jgi:sugar lactone lactonase YvrE
LTALSYPADFSEAGGDANACTGSTSLSPGLECDVPVEFTPEHGGTLSENVTLTDNALNVAGSMQSIGVTGMGLSPTAATHFTVTTAASVVAGEPFSITVTAIDSLSQTATTYNGTVSFTSSDPDFVNPGPLTLSSGVGKATVTLETLGTQTIATTDTTTSSLTGSGSFTVAAAPPPVIFTGTAANENFGSHAIGSTSAAKSYIFSVAAGTTVGSIEVVTTGVANLDFANASGSTCAATTYASASTCKVNVTFKPRFAGSRKGAIVFYSAANRTGNQLASVPIYGVGTGPQIAYSPGAVVNILSEIGDGSLVPNGSAEDSAGDLFISDLNGNGVVEVPAGGHPWTEIYPAANGIPLNYPAGLAVDGAGNLFIASQGSASVLEVPAGGGAAIAIRPVVNGSGLYEPAGAAVDAIGDLFIGDYGNNRVVEVPAGNGAPILIDPTVAGKTLSTPGGVALNEAGDLFIADAGNNRVVVVPAGGSAATVIDPSVGGLGLSFPTQVVVDGAGDLFIADHGNNRIVEVPAGGGAATATQVAGPTQLNWVTVDDAGDQFISASPWLGQASLVEVLRSQPPALNFPTPTDVGYTDIADGIQTVQVQNIGNEALKFKAPSYPADFSEASGDASACTGSTGLSAGQECEVPVEFTPEHSGALTESVTITDNALNVIGAKQSIAVSGTGVGRTGATLTSPTPGSTLTGPDVTFKWTAATGATGYELLLGSKGAGSSNLYHSGIKTVTSLKVSGLPTNGEKIYARILTKFNGASVHADYTYTATRQAALTSPKPDSKLTGPSVTFAWTAAAGATGYELWLGSKGVGSSNLYKSGNKTTTSLKVEGPPTNGEKIYARIFTNYDGSLVHADYEYKAHRNCREMPI